MNPVYQTVPLTEEERGLLDPKDLATGVDPLPAVMLVEEHTISGPPLWPRSGTVGRLLSSWVGPALYLHSFARRSLRSGNMVSDPDLLAMHAERLREEAEAQGYPIVLIGPVVAQAFNHTLPAYVWSRPEEQVNNDVTHVVAIPEKNPYKPHVMKVLEEAAMRSAWPAFQTVGVGYRFRCGSLAIQHPAHPRHPGLRVACPKDFIDGRVVLPYG